jgi:L-threonylcarbamoyladenylate synthase
VKVSRVREPDVAEAAGVLAAGGVVAYPTETVYGLAVDARSAAAVARLLALKGRDEGRGISVLVTDLAMAAPLLATSPTDEALRLARAFWPGPLTIVLAAAAGVPAALLGPSGGIGLRCSSDEWARALVASFAAPLTSTSANVSGEAPARSAAEARAAFASAASPPLVLDGGERRGTEVSTVVEFAQSRATVLRDGAISRDEIAAVLPGSIF